GIVVGVIAKFVLNLALYRRAMAISQPAETRPSLLRNALDFFQSPVRKRELIGTDYHLYLDKPLVCFNSMKLSKELDMVPSETKAVYVHLNRQVGVIDHTSCETLMHVVQEFSHNNVPVEIIGLDQMRPLSEYPACTRLATPAFAAAY